MRTAISLVLSLLATACVSSSIELTSGPDTGPQVDAGSPDADREDAGVDAAIYVECVEPSDCVLISKCCDECGPQYGDVLSVPRDGPVPARPASCETLDCGSCAEYYPEPKLIPDCVENECVIIDLEELGPLNECGLGAGGDECLLRASACCECDLDPYYDTLVSIAQSREADYLDRVCGGMSCPPCEEPNYGDFEAFCDEIEEGVGRCSFYGPEDD